MMKRIITSFAVFSTLLSFYSCNDDENVNPENPKDSSGQVVKLTLDGIDVRDSLSFSYEEDKVKSIAWCTSLGNNDCALEYSETRLYNGTGKLTSLGGRWQATYEYENGLRKTIVASYNNQPYSTTTFLNYSGIYPARIKVVNAISEIRYVDLFFNDAGDLTRKTIRNENEVLLEDVHIAYTEHENPLHGLLETPSYAVLFFGFDDFVFYFSKHFPDKVSIEYSEQNPIAPKTFIIDYEISLGEDDKIVSANAFRDLPGQHINTHNILIGYEK